VNALYHAKNDKELKDKFQGNSNVLVRIYHIDPKNKDFMEALIIATNSQNAIRAEDLVANDKPQHEIEEVLKRYGIFYERKEGLTVSKRSWLTLSKENAAMAFMGVFWRGFASKLRNAVSKKEFFRRGEEYAEVFSWGVETDPAPRFPAATPKERGLQFVAATSIVELVRAKIVEAGIDTVRRRSLRKAAFFLSRACYVRGKQEIDAALAAAVAESEDKKSAETLKKSVEQIAEARFAEGLAIFVDTMAEYIKTTTVDEDSALKNTKFSILFEERLESTPRKA
jgi:hypothetical protein